MFGNSRSRRERTVRLAGLSLIDLNDLCPPGMDAAVLTIFVFNACALPGGQFLCFESLPLAPRFSRAKSKFDGTTAAGVSTENNNFATGVPCRS